MFEKYAKPEDGYRIYDARVMDNQISINAFANEIMKKNELTSIIISHPLFVQNVNLAIKTALSDESFRRYGLGYNSSVIRKNVRERNYFVISSDEKFADIIYDTAFTKMRDEYGKSEECLNEIVRRFADVDNKNMRDEVEFLKNDVKNLRLKLRADVEKINNYTAQLMYGNPAKQKENIKKLLKLPEEHSMIKSIRGGDNGFYFTTEPIKLYEPISNSFYQLGCIDIYLNAEGELYFYPAKEGAILRYGYWNKHDNSMVHPHVDTDGKPCLGNTAILLSEAWSENRFDDMIKIALSYLSTCNVEDIAGYAVSFFDEIDSEGNVINKGHAPESDEYGFDSGMYREYHTVFCDRCDAERNEDDLTYIPSEDRRVCFDCLDRYYVWSDYMDEYIDADEAIEVKDKNGDYDWILPEREDDFRRENEVSENEE